MADLVLNILSLGTKPLYENQWRFHNLIADFRSKLARLEETPLAEADIESFYNALNTFDFRFVFFSDYYKKYIANLNRFKPEQVHGNMDVTFLLLAIAEDKWKPTAPFPVFSYHLKYKFPLASRVFISRQKSQNRKKINTPEQIAKHTSKFDPSKKWTRVPLQKERCEPGCGCGK